MNETATGGAGGGAGGGGGLGNGNESDEKRMECMKILDHTIRTYREQRYDLELMLETAPVSLKIL